MRRLEQAPEARRDTVSLLADSLEGFGLAARRRYGRLLRRAFRDLQIDPERLGVDAHPDIPPDLRLYHLRWSRDRSPDGVVRPRHFVVFRFDAQRVEIVRVLHDAMDITSRLGEP